MSYLFARKLTRHARSVLWTHPALYVLVNAFRHRRAFYNDRFDLCVAGFPRSANSFALRMLESTQPGLRVRSHHHHPAVAIRALQLRKPVLFVVRSPEAAIVSWAIHQARPVRWILEYYIDFHRLTLPYATQLLVADFETVTKDFKSVIRGLNARFGCGFQDGFEEQVEARRAFAEIERSVTLPDGAIDHRRLHVPSVAREDLKKPLLEAYHSPENARSVAEADRLYHLFSAFSLSRPAARAAVTAEDRSQASLSMKPSGS